MTVRVILATLLLALAARADERAVKVDAAIRRAAGVGGAGIAAAVVSGTEVLYAKGSGFANIASRTPITTRTCFDLASCSKQFTAMAVMILAERGKLGLDDDVRRFLPELRPRAKGRAVAVSDLLHHTSGLKDYLELLSPEEMKEGKNEGVLARLAREKRAFGPGKQHAYSNTNYALLALVVERASGRPFASFLRDEVFRPLGMESTVVLEREGQAIPDRATGYARRGRSWAVDVLDLPVVGDGNVFSSVDDLVRWDRGLREGKLIGRAMLERAFTPGALDDGTEHGYGFGWVISRDDDGRRCASHDGGWNGTSTSIARYLDDGLTVIVLWNAGGEDAEALCDAIARIYRAPS
jgi:CubicO group peptidase (beta-lactamase class C family)